MLGCVVCGPQTSEPIGFCGEALRIIVLKFVRIEKFNMDMVPLDEEAPKAVKPVSLHIDVAGLVLLLCGVHLTRSTASSKDNQTQKQYYG